MSLHEKNCTPCQGGVPALPQMQKQNLLAKLHQDWQLTHDETRLFRDLPFEDFQQAMDFAGKVAKIADEQWHHPELHIGFKHCAVEIWTHKINDLVESDFIFAAKVDKISDS